MKKGLLIGLGLSPKSDSREEEEEEGSEEESSAALDAFKDVAELIKDENSSSDDIAQALKDAVYVCMNEKEEE